MDSLFRQLFKGFVRQEFRLESYMTFPKGHWLDLLELLLAHLGDGALTELQDSISGFVPSCNSAIKHLPPPCSTGRGERQKAVILSDPPQEYRTDSKDTEVE